MSIVHECLVRACRDLGDSVSSIVLASPGANLPRFAAGQYLKALLPGSSGSYFSIASPPCREMLELHVEHRPDSVTAPALSALALQGGRISVEMPLGTCGLERVPNGPLLLVASQSGFAQSKSILEYLRLQRFHLPVQLLWLVSANYRSGCAPVIDRLQASLDFKCQTVPREAPAPLRDHLFAAALQGFRRQAPGAEVLISGSRDLTDRVVGMIGTESVFSDFMEKSIS